jgi:hypothetical protein
MRKYQQIMLVVISLTAGANVYAQFVPSWPEHTEPGLRFDQLHWCNDTSTVQWIRSHHLKSFTCISYSFNYPHRIDSIDPHDTVPVFDSSKYSPVADTETWTFSYSGDTLIASNFNGFLDATSVIKFDMRNTEREYGSFQKDPVSTDIILYDSLGRELSHVQYRDDTVESATIAKINDSGNWISNDYEGLKSILYWGSSRRIDSEIEWSHESDKYPNELTLSGRIYNYFNERNQIIASQRWEYNDQEPLYIDSTIRDRNGNIIRSEDRFDSHGNVIFSLNKVTIREHCVNCLPLPCSNPLDTEIMQYVYDEEGRPVERTQKFISVPGLTNAVSYKWREDNLPLSCSYLGSKGSIVLAEKYLYEF